ncbi:MAG: AIR carboxylase family protein [Cyanobacteria bacterium NC_groundwater_1444_Ag_S-0.65um_54_12]|nr:AIR carboxylase family protein [Cyanobacteria bacterium NC_groundwater_1444_Ag_S-0.65um_54_12]
MPDPNVMVARAVKPYPLEVIVRGFLTGSAWKDYQEGVFKQKYGFELPAGLSLNARLPVPVITPTRKVSTGHDTPLTLKEAEQSVGGAETWSEIERIALQLFEQGSGLAQSRGLLLADTKYEFGQHADRLMLIDEVHTPDSSRYWYTASYAENPRQPHQLSKEFLRDYLRSQGFSGEGPLPRLPDALRLTLAGRYLTVYQQLTGEQLDRSLATPLGLAERIWRNLKRAGYLKGTMVFILSGSPADREIARRVAERLTIFDIPSQEVVVSAHKVPDKLFKLLAQLNSSVQPLILITIAGRSNGLSGACAANSVHPVIALPNFADKVDYLVNIHSSLQLPSETPAMTVIDPDNAALAAVRMLSLTDNSLQARLGAHISRIRATFGL